MSTITLRIPDSKHERLKQYAKTKELAIVALVQFNAKTRFIMNASKGDTLRGLNLLDKLDNTL